MQSELVRIGTVARPHGLRGDLVVRAEGDVLATLAPGEAVRLRGPDGRVRTVTLRFLRPDRDRWLAAFEELPDRTAAESVRSAEILIEADRLPPLAEGAYYHADLIGLRVATDDGDELGRLVRIIETGAHDVYEIVDEQGRETLVPAVEQFIALVDLQQGRMVVRLVEGMRDAD